LNFAGDLLTLNRNSFMSGSGKKSTIIAGDA
jgi:hypothetical protein